MALEGKASAYYELRASREGNEGGNRTGSILKAGLHLGADWTLSYMPRIGNDIPTGKPGPWKEDSQGSPSPKRIP